VSSILTTLAPKRRALIVPMSGAVCPGRSIYEAMAQRPRQWGVDVYGFLPPFGVVPEASVGAFPEVYQISQGNQRALCEEMAARTRAWLELHGPRYDRIVVVPHGDYIGLWTLAVQGPKRSRRPPVEVASNIVTVPPHRSTGLRGRIFLNKLHKALM